jgi:hypothetical protein
MTISSNDRRVQYPGDGGTTSFVYPFRIIRSSDLLVVLQDAAGVDTVQVLDSAYTVSGVGDATGGSISMAVAPAVGERLSVILAPDVTQLLDLIGGGVFPIDNVEEGLDNLTNIAKRVLDLASRSMGLKDGDLSGSGAYQAGGNRIESLEAPVNDDDAATKATVDAAVTAAQLVLNPNVIVASGLGYLFADLFYDNGKTGAVERSLNSKMGELQSVTDFGATGDGVTDDTAFVQAACDAGGWIYFPPGTYLVDQVDVTAEVHLVLAPTAILKQRSGTASTNQAILEFTTGSDYSTLEGGQLDGNRAGLTASYTDEIWVGIRVRNAPEHIQVRNILIKDFMHSGFYHGSGNFCVYENIHVKDCGKGAIVQIANNGRLEHILFEGIGNRTFAIYQHAIEFRDADHLHATPASSRRRRRSRSAG